MFWKHLHQLTADMDLPTTAGNLFVKQVEIVVIVLQMQPMTNRLF